MDVKKVLRMWYMSQFVDVIVDDSDKCTSLDVLVDLFEGAEKKMIRLPEYLHLSYEYNGEIISLTKEDDFVKMFDSLAKEDVIQILLSSRETACHLVSVARGFMATKKQNTTQNLSTLSSSSNPNITDRTCLVPRPKLLVRRCTMEENGNQNPPSPRSYQEDIISQSPQMMSSHNAIDPLQTNSTQKPFVETILASNSHVLASFSKKIPPTTARRKALQISKEGVSQSTSSQYSLGVDDQYSLCVDDFEPSHITIAEEAHEFSGTVDELEEDDVAIHFVDDGFVSCDASYQQFNPEGSYFDTMYSNGELYMDDEIGNIKLRPWMLFTNKDHFKDVLTDYCIQEGFAIILHKTDRKRYTVVCAAQDCGWRIHASRMPDSVTWAIKSIRLPDHSCTKFETYNPMATPEWAANKIIEDVRANEAIPAKSLNNLLFERYGVELKRTSMYKMKPLAMKEIQGPHDTSYELLPAYCEAVKRTNNGSCAHCSWRVIDEVPEKPIQFKYIFLCFKAQVDGFIQGCRGLIGVDGTHLKGHYGGILLSAIGLDGNNAIFPIAYAIVDCESKSTWSQFFWHLRECLKHSPRNDWTIISDRQKGVEPALEDIWPNLPRRFCCRHLCSNFKKVYPGILMHTLFWSACNAYSEFTFNKVMERIQKEKGMGDVQWLNDLGDKKSWARHKFDPSMQCDVNTSNFVESFNSTLGVDRCAPVLTLLEGIRRVCMVRHSNRQEAAEKWDINGITPNTGTKLKKLTLHSRNCQVHKAGKGEFEIKDGRSFLPVSINNRTCACGQWQISGIPCTHAIRASKATRKPPEGYVAHWFYVKTYRRTYQLNMFLIPDPEQWPPNDLPKLKPPPLKRGSGRPTRNRIREEGEKRKGRRSTTVQCKKCKAFGHNIRSCQGGPTTKERRASKGVRVEQRTRKRKATTSVEM